MTAKAGFTQRRERSVLSTKAGKIAISSVLGIVMLTALFLIASLICLHKNASGFVLQAAAYACSAVSSFFAGVVAAKAIGRSGLVYGSLASLPICIFLLILCVSMYGSVGYGYMIASALMLLSGASGGIAALNLRRRRRRYK